MCIRDRSKTWVLTMFKLRILNIVKKFIPGSSVLDTRKKNICVFNVFHMYKRDYLLYCIFVNQSLIYSYDDFCMQNIKSSISMRKIFWRVVIVYFMNMRYYVCEIVLNEGTSLISCGRVFHSPITVGTREVYIYFSYKRLLHQLS